MKWSWQSHAYLCFARMSAPIWRLALARRVRRGKEDPERLTERFGNATHPRPSGKLIWVHALSVGETLALLGLLDDITSRHPNVSIVLTSSTRSSATALSTQSLPNRVYHQMLPVDAHGPVTRFLAHWRPDLVVVSELDLWPCALFHVHKHAIPLLLINSRISDRNFAKRKRGAAIFRDLLSLFEQILVQDDVSQARMISLGAAPNRVSVSGALKGAPRVLDADPNELAALKNAIGARPVWLAASSEPRESAQILEAHRLVREQKPDALLILAPRNPDQLTQTLDLLHACFSCFARRTRGDLLTPDCPVYLADTIGEMGLWYRLAPITFVGHSLPVSGRVLRGKNPFEAAALNSAVIHGPNVIDFAETYAAFDEAKAALQVKDPATLADGVRKLFDTGIREQMISSAQDVIKTTAEVKNRHYRALAAFL